jgi:GNAT superfamily N-acetyltransferase
MARHERLARADEILTLVGLAGFGARQVGRLSGGEAKRVALARSLAPRPKVLLLDEPLTGLDRDLHDRLAVEVAAILREAGTTAVWVTHDADEAATVADRTVRLGPVAVRSLPAMGAEIVELRVADTHPLRRSILRNDTPSHDVVFDGDDLPGTLHLGASVDGEIVAISTWVRRPWSAQRDRPAVQLRGMATAPDHRGTGVSAALLEAGIDRCRSDGVEVVWARARVAALGFYRRAGFVTVGEPYLDATTALPHCDIVRPLT